MVLRSSHYIAKLFASACLVTLATTALTAPIQEPPSFTQDPEQLLSDDILLVLPGETPITVQDIPRYTWTAGQLLEQGRFAEAVYLCEQLLEMQQDNIEARAHLAAAYKGLGYEEKFDRELKILTGQAPTSAAIHLSLAATYISLKEFALAETTYKNGLDVASAPTELHMGLGALYLEQQRLQEASDQYLKVLEQKGLEYKQFLNASFALCRIGLQEERYDDVIRRAKAVTEIYPPIPQGHLLLGTAYREKGESKQAIKAYQQLIELNPQVPDAYRELVLTYLENLADANKALHYAQEGARRFPEYARMQDILGWVYYKKEQYPEAVDQFRKAVQLSDDDPTLLYHLGLSLQKTGDNRQASEAFQQALGVTDTHEASAFADELQQRIDQSQ